MKVMCKVTKRDWIVALAVVDMLSANYHNLRHWGHYRKYTRISRMGNNCGENLKNLFVVRTIH